MPQFDEEQFKPEKIDKKDHDILNLLLVNARTSYQQIAKKVKLSHDAVAYRIKRMEKLGIIDKYTIDISSSMFGFNEYHILFQLLESNTEPLEEFYKYLKENIHAMHVIRYTDKWDLKVTFFSKDIEEMDDILTNINNKFSDMIVDYEIMAKVKTYFPHYIEYNNADVKLDDTDKKIISILSDNSRLSLVDIGKKVNLSSDAIIYRMKKYHETKLIHRYYPILNVNKMGYHWYNLLLMMKFFSKKEKMILMEFAKQKKQIVRVMKTIGNWNIIMTVLATGPAEFHGVVKELRSTFANNIKDFDALLAYKELKYSSLEI